MASSLSPSEDCAAAPMAAFSSSRGADVETGAAPEDARPSSSLSQVTMASVMAAHGLGAGSRLRGRFALHSRGPFRAADAGGADGYCYNTVVSSCSYDKTQAFANPAVADNRRMVQFISCNDTSAVCGSGSTPPPGSTGTMPL